MPLPVGWRAEISRKVLHLSTALIAVIYWFTPRPLMLALLLACVAIATTVEVARRQHAGFHQFFRTSVGFMVRAAEWHRISGATYVLLGSLLAILLFPKNHAIAGILVLAIADTAASLIGLRFGRTRFLGKSLAGSTACFVTATAVLVLTAPVSPAVAFLGGLVAALAEAAPSPRFSIFELNDNVTIPVLTAATTWLIG